MRKIELWFLTAGILLGGCAVQDEAQQDVMEPVTGAIEIQQSWQGDYPVNQLSLLPEGQRESGLGYLGSTEAFAPVWKVFRPGEPVPRIDFKTSLVLFMRNTQFYNRINVGQVRAEDGIVEVLAMETLSAMPIEEKVALSLVTVTRAGIVGIQDRDRVIPVQP